MKILQVIPYFCFGGAETMCENLTYALTALGHEVTVVSLYDEHTPISDRMEAAGTKIHYLDKRLGADASMVPKLYRIMKQERPDVVHTHLDVVKYAAVAARLAGVKKCIHTVHNVAHKEAEGLAQIINRVYFRLGWAKPVALSPEVQNTIAGVYGLPDQDVPVIYNGIDLNRYIPKTAYSDRETMVLLHIGRFNEQKDHEGLLRAFQSLHSDYPQCQLHLVGDGELRDQIEALAGELSLENSVVFHGAMPDVRPFLHSADIFLLPSRYEGMPMTIIEAMATGLPIVATRVGGVPDMVHDGKSALVVPRKTEAVAQACRRLIQDPALRESLGRAALRDSRRFSAEYMAESYCRVYQQ